MLTKTDKAILENGLRWCSNILVELLGNYGRHLPTDGARQALRNAVTELDTVQRHLCGQVRQGEDYCLP